MFLSTSIYTFAVPQWAQHKIQQWPQGVSLSPEQLAQWVNRDLERLNDQQQARVFEAGALTAYQ